jgi:large subunit ribosomal protein L2
MKKKKPNTPGQRGMISHDYSILTKKSPEKSLIYPIKKTGGRNKKGRITVRHRGGGEKKMYRKIDFGNQKLNIPAKVEAVEYDPNRSAFIMLVLFKDGERRYMLAPEGIKVNNEIIFGEKTPIQIGNRTKIKNIPVGIQVFNIALLPEKAGTIVRSAGSSAQLLSKEEGYATIVLPSREVRKVPEECYATIGVVSNIDHKTEILGKAGKARHRGQKPRVRGVAMNPVDHPHGGGEGRSPIGMKYPKTRSGKPAFGVRTRNKRKFSNRYIIKRRRKKK